MRRGLLVVALLGALGASSARVDAATPSLSFACSPPVPATQQSCAVWHNSPVTLYWYYAAPPSGGDCTTPHVFTKDTASLPVSCTITQCDPSGCGSLGYTVYLHIDRTAPTITAAVAARGPDHNGWWNHPVTFSFAGTDATSKVASCDTVTYSGPGGPGAQVVGGCRDHAGNYRTRGFPIAYDAAPPSLDVVKAVAASRSAVLSWTVSPDTTLVRVMRRPGRRRGTAKLVYSGDGRRFGDTGLTNGTRYRYTVTAIDQAGNAASRTVAARPRLSLGLRPRHGARYRRPPRLRWPGIRHADYYNVQIYRAGVGKVLSAWPHRAHLKLHRHWTFQGRRVRLKPGRYRWYVWPGYGPRPEHRYGAFIGQSSFIIVR